MATKKGAANFLSTHQSRLYLIEAGQGGHIIWAELKINVQFVWY